MPRLLFGRFPALTEMTPDQRRAMMIALVDDLQLLVASRPLALSTLALLARKLAAPVRKQLALEQQAERKEKTSSE